MKNQNQLLEFLETEAKHHNQKLTEKLDALKSEIRTKEKETGGKAHVIATPVEVEEDLRGDVLLPGE